VILREAARADLSAIVALLADDDVARGREGAEAAAYEAAFARIRASGSTTVIVGEEGGRIVATYQLSLLPGLSRGGATRALIEGVRVAADLRGGGRGRLLMADAERRARSGGASVLQLTTDQRRERAHRFYEACGFTATHLGFKRGLD
jgi:GNAT superfamily N-acetyltransferase